MNPTLRAELEQRLPSLFQALRSIRNRRYFRRAFGDLQESVRQHLFPNGAAIVVQSGPFRGLRYLDETVWGSITPKWLGSYEAELHPALADIVKRAYGRIIDVGCAEGYYAVGLAVAIPETTVYAFDTDFISRRQLLRLAELNQVGKRMVVGAGCGHAQLDELATPGSLVVCDIEGAEVQLLDPEAAPMLSAADLLVEVHEVSEDTRSTEALLQARFAGSHRIERIAVTGREAWIDRQLLQIRKMLPPEVLTEAVKEHRSGKQVWLWMQANGRDV